MKFKKAVSFILSFLMFLGNPSIWLAEYFSAPVQASLAVFVGTLLMSARAAAGTVRRGLESSGDSYPTFSQMDPSQWHLSANALDSDIESFHLMELPFYPTTQPDDPNENTDLATALNAAVQSGLGGDLSSLGDFAKAHPQSRWVLSVSLNRGLALLKNGYYSLALDSFQQAWESGKNEPSGAPKAFADRALSEWVLTEARLGMKNEAKTHLELANDRLMTGQSAKNIESARIALADLGKTAVPQNSCGASALENILDFSKPNTTGNHGMGKLPNGKLPGPKGYSMNELLTASKSQMMDLQLAKRDPGAAPIVPSLVHWKVGHFTALVDEQNGKYLSRDPVFETDHWVTVDVLDKESSGYFLVPQGDLPDGWHAVDSTVGENLRGRGAVNISPPSIEPCVAPKGSPSPSGGVGGGSPKVCGAHGMPQASIDLSEVGLLVQDTPLSYTPPVGPTMDFTLTYQSEAANQLPFTSFGTNWSFNWLGYFQALQVYGALGKNADASPVRRPIRPARYNQSHRDRLFRTNPESGRQSHGRMLKTQVALGSTAIDVSPMPSLVLYPPGGGEEPIYNGNSRFVPSNITGGIGNGSSTPYVRTMPDGSQEVYGFAYGGITLLTEVLDSKGNRVSLSYDKFGRLTAITDALGQVSTISYYGTPGTRLGPTVNEQGYFANPNPPQGTSPFGLVQDMHSGYLVSQITDPFGRSCSFHYDALGHLISITDQGNLTSTFTYNTNASFSGDLITGMVTPYGPTSFSYAFDPNTGNKDLELTDPLGQKEHAQFNQNFDSSNFSDFTADAPHNSAYEADPMARNIFYWSKKAMAVDPLDFASAKIYHYMHSGYTDQMYSPLMSALKNPLEGWIFYTYGGSQPVEIEPSVSTLDKPTQMARFVSDINGNQTTQKYLWTYDSLGHVSNYTDPMSRQFTYNYDPNNHVDLLSVRDSNSDTLGSYVYNSQHEPTSYTDAAGKVWGYSYNTYGQLKQVSPPVDGPTNYNYDSNGFLISVVPPQPGAGVTYTYDNVGRVQTKSSAADGTVVYQYDSFDRVTRASYQDGTFEQYGYDRLDLVSYRDRQGRTTAYVYDALQRVTSVTDPKSQTTLYGWCACGSLISMTDPKGNQTTWDRDIEGRVVKKTYQDDTQELYQYDAFSGLLEMVQDGNGQQKQYAYDDDGQLNGVNYVFPKNPTPNVTFDHTDVIGRLHSMTDGTGTTQYSYVPFGQTGGGRLKTVTQPVGTAMANITYAYDADGRISSRSIDSSTESYGFNNGELTNVANPLGSFTYNYDNSARLNQVLYPNGQVTNMDYFNPSDPQGQGRLKDITNLGAGSTSGQTLSKFGYTYTPGGDIKTWSQQLDNNPADSKTYGMGYDPDSELTSATLNSGTSGFDGLTNGQSVSFGYDAAGNRTTEQNPAFKHNFDTNNVNQLTDESDQPISVAGSTNKPANVTVNGQRWPRTRTTTTRRPSRRSRGRARV